MQHAKWRSRGAAGYRSELQRGDFVAIVGPSGAGKTTLLNMITAVDKPTRGEVVVGDKSVTRTPQPQLTRWRAKNIGIVFQFFQLLPTISVVDNIVFPMDYAYVHKPAQRRDYALSWLARLGIEDQAEKRPDMLSGGQQRTAIARVLANDPPLIVGDEPTGNLDSVSAGLMFALFEDLIAQGKTMVMVAHDKDLAGKVSRVPEVRDGQLLDSSEVDGRLMVRAGNVQGHRCNYFPGALMNWYPVQSRFDSRSCLR